MAIKYYYFGVRLHTGHIN